MNWHLFFYTFGLIFVAELPDKTAFATLLLATRKHPVAVFVGVAAAFTIQSLIAVSFGSLFSRLPEHWVKMAAGLLFLGLAIAMWLRKEPEESEMDLPSGGALDFFKTAWISFVVIFLAEWGDLTQIATAALAARNRAPVTIFVSATSALWAVTALAIAIGHGAKRALRPRLIQKISAVAFALVGLILLLR